MTETDDLGARRLSGVRRLAHAALALVLATLPDAVAGGLTDDLPGAAATVAHPRPAHPVEVHVALVLRESRFPDAPEADELAARIVEPGIATLEPLLDLLEQERVPRTGILPDEKDQILSVPQRALVLAALERLDDRAVHAALERRLVPPVEPARAVAAIDVLGAVGDARRLARMLELVPAEAGEPSEHGERAQDALGAAVTKILRRDELALAEVARLFATAPVLLHPTLITALGAARDPRALPLFARVIAEHPELARQTIAQIVLVGRSAERAANEALAELLRERIDAGRPEVDAGSILALGELADARSIARLVDLLEHGERAVRENALWALRRATGESFPAEGGAWKRWHAREAAWFEVELPQALRNLRSTRASEVAAAIRSIGARRLRRDELASELASVLQRPETQLRVLVCPTLASLGSAAAIEPLLRARDDANPRVAGAAAAALSVLKKADLPRDARRWSEPGTRLAGE